MTSLERLAKKKDFDRVFSEGKAVKDKSLRLLAAPNDIGEPRIGLAVPKRLVRLATRRNRLRRLIRETLREHAERLPAADIVAVWHGPLPDRERVPGPEVRSEVARLVGRLAARPPS